MKLHVAQTRARKWIRVVNADGWGEVVQPVEQIPRRTEHGVIADNGAFICHQQGREFDAPAFEVFLRVISRDWPVQPRFIVVPDIVGGGIQSLRFSASWVARMDTMLDVPDCPRYLAVQDGMTVEDVLAELWQYDGLFVGGLAKWKLLTGKTWVDLAHANGRPCHIGRVGTANRILWARSTDCDSADSAIPIMSEENHRAAKWAMDVPLTHNHDHYLSESLRYLTNYEKRSARHVQGD